MHWRNVGPFRGGRTRALAGVPSQPNVFYIGVVNGGVWKTTDYGRTWKPIFDHAANGVHRRDRHRAVGSEHCLCRKRRRPASARPLGGRWHLQVDRRGRDLDASRTARWAADSEIAVDPRNPNRLFVAVAGHPYGPNAERGIYRSTDGGQNFQKVLYKDENIGGNDVEIDPADPKAVYATLWQAREGPWENGAWNGTGGGIFKSTDGGRSWKPACRRIADGHCSGLCDDRSQQSQAADSRWSRSRTRWSFIAPRMPARSWSTVTTDSRPKNRIGGGDLAGSRDRSQKSRRDLRDQHVDVEIDGRRQDMDWHSAAPRAATIIRTSGSIPTTPASSRWPATRARSSA